MEDTGAMAQLPQYQSHKKVRALKIESVEQVGCDTTTDENPIVMLHFENKTFAPIRLNLLGKPTPQAGWYYVVYEDGYTSFSPAEAFESGYTSVDKDADFRKGLSQAINRASKENGSDTPDFILAAFLADCLTAFDKAIASRVKWFSHS